MSRQLNRATLERQLLLRRSPISVADAVRQVLALQAQEPVSPYLALWNRVAGLSPADVDCAFADGTLARATLLRVTLHAVHAEDWPTVQSAVAPLLRSSRLGDGRWAASGLSTAEADAALARLAAFATAPRSGAEIERMLGQKWMWWALRTLAPLHYVPNGGAWSFRHPAAFVAAPGALDDASHDRSVRTMVSRYLSAFGPASTSDMVRFTRLGAGRIRAALGDDLIAHPGGLLDVPGGTLPPEDTPAPPRLLPMWDNVLLAYADRGRLVPPAYRTLVYRRNGDVLPTVLVDGYVAGVWRPTDDGEIEVRAFHPLDDDTWSGLAAEARSLCAFLAGRGATGYGRFRHWWTKGMPAAEVRLLPAA